MIKIVATEEQAKALADAQESVEIVDSQGNRLGYFARPFTDDDLRIAKHRLASAEPRRPTKAIIDRLQSMDDQ